jgi:nitroimidazol reductase NimA-like FMN-containing flavoprotein (pyridoxamine 5'-phosphate oxidase superfamily)
MGPPLDRIGVDVHAAHHVGKVRHLNSDRFDRYTGSTEDLQVSLQMTKSEREAFLAETHVAVISIPQNGLGPLTVPIWYRYEPGGDIRMITNGTSKKARLIRQAERFSLCVQTETPPYQYVSVEGPARVSADYDYEKDIREVALRYLGEEMGELYLAGTGDDRQNAVVVALTPEHWTSEDYNKL